MRDSIRLRRLCERYFVACYFGHVLKGIELEVMQDALPLVLACWSGGTPPLSGLGARARAFSLLGGHVGSSRGRLKVTQSLL